MDSRQQTTEMTHGQGPVFAFSLATTWRVARYRQVEETLTTLSKLPFVIMQDRGQSFKKGGAAATGLCSQQVPIQEERNRNTKKARNRV